MTHSFTSQMLADTLTVINFHLLVGYPAFKVFIHVGLKDILDT